MGALGPEVVGAGGSHGGGVEGHDGTGDVLQVVKIVAGISFLPH